MVPNYRRPRRHTIEITDRMILEREEWMYLLEAISKSRVRRIAPGIGMKFEVDHLPLDDSLNWAVRTDLIHLSAAVDPILLPRALRLLQIRRGELPMPPPG